MNRQSDTHALLDAALDRLNNMPETGFWTVLDGPEEAPSTDKPLMQQAFGQFGRFGRSEEENVIPTRHDVHVHDRPERFDEHDVADHKNLLLNTVQSVQIVQNPEKLNDIIVVRFGRFGDPTVQNQAPTVQNAAEPAQAGPVAGLEGTPDLLSEWADGVTRFCRMGRLADVPPIRWKLLQQRAVDFCRVWGPTAHALSWRALDLFGCHRLKPYYRLDAAGLVWLLTDREVVAMSPDAATLRTPSGARQTYRRRRDPVLDQQRVPVWELPTEARRDPQSPAPTGGAS